VSVEAGVATPAAENAGDRLRQDATRQRWVTFDCFGTLVDWHTGFAAIVRPLAGDRTPALLDAYHRFERLLEKEAPHRLYREVLGAGLMKAAVESGVFLSDADVQSLAAAWGLLPLFDDVEPMLRSLRAAGFRLGVLTNCDEDLFEQTHRSFQERFDLVVTAERVRDYKPSPTHFHYFGRATGATRAEWVHVACSWYHDISPARELSIRRVWLDRDRTGEDPATASAYVQSADQVFGAVARLFDG
jgi:2-haloacid dehalogenase